MVISEYLVDWY